MTNSESDHEVFRVPDCAWAMTSRPLMINHDGALLDSGRLLAAVGADHPEEAVAYAHLVEARHHVHARARRWGRHGRFCCGDLQYVQLRCTANGPPSLSLSELIGGRIAVILDSNCNKVLGNNIMRILYRQSKSQIETMFVVPKAERREGKMVATATE